MKNLNEKIKRFTLPVIATTLLLGAQAQYIRTFFMEDLEQMEKVGKRAHFMNLAGMSMAAYLFYKEASSPKM